MDVVTFDDAKARLVVLARQHAGVVTAKDVESDAQLSADHETTSAAAHALAGSTNVFATGSKASRWFPYEEIRFTDLR